MAGSPSQMENGFFSASKVRSYGTDAKRGRDTRQIVERGERGFSLGIEPKDEWK